MVKCEEGEQSSSRLWNLLNMLDVRNIDVFYGDVQALWDVSFSVAEGEVVTLIGANGAGKSTALKAICRLLAPRQGSIELERLDITGIPTERLVEQGIVLVPEGRQLWPGMTVLENLLMGAYSPAAREARDGTLQEVLAMFPQLARRARQKA